MSDDGYHLDRIRKAAVEAVAKANAMREKRARVMIKFFPIEHLSWQYHAGKGEPRIVVDLPDDFQLAPDD